MSLHNPQVAIRVPCKQHISFEDRRHAKLKRTAKNNAMYTGNDFIYLGIALELSDLKNTFVVGYNC